MPAVTRLGHRCTGHDCWPPRLVIQGSPNVFVNGQPITRQGDTWGPHTCGNNTHSGVQSQGAPTVFANGMAVARIGDMISCGSASAEGSSNVFIGG